jgi:SAM-dependent methyltransferase
MTEFPNWFHNSDAESNFVKHLVTKFAGVRSVRALQIGAYVGHASEWLLTNALTGEGSHLIDVDTWQGSPGEEEHDALDWEQVKLEYRTRMAPYFGRTVAFTGTSDEFFAFAEHAKFDLIYVDGSHERAQVRRDADNAHRALNHHGILIFDDYRWTGHRIGNNPRDAIDPFLTDHSAEYKVLEHNGQLVLERLVPRKFTVLPGGKLSERR